MEVWKFLAGLAIFLFGMQLLEQGLKGLAGRPFKKFLRRQTTTPLKGILGGIGVTGVLQSSTLISLMMIAFVGAGVLSLHNAIGVIFGANLGTTATGWIVATLGFDLDIESFALPMIAIGGLILIFFQKWEQLSQLGRLILGFGFLFFGLSFMKETIEALTEHEMDVTAFIGFHPYLFYPIGILLAGLINSGSAVMVMGLSALSVGLIPLEAAAALAIGGDLGKTSTAIIGSLGGTAVQKQVAASHVLFNLCTNVLALSLLYPLVWIITEVLGIKSPLYSLVTIHSLTNLLGIVVLFPFIPAITNFLNSKFKKGAKITKYISRVPTSMPDAAIDALHNEILHLADNVMALNLEGLRIDEEDITSNPEDKKRGFASGSYIDRYHSVKQLQGEALKYFVGIQNEKLDPEDSVRLNQHAHALRHLLKSAKRLKDVTHNIRDFVSSGNDVKHGMFVELRAKLTELYTGVHDLLHTNDQRSYHESLVQLVTQNRGIYEVMRTESYHNGREGHLTEVELATFQNANHEIYSSNKALLEALADMLLTREELTAFEQLPDLL